MNIEELQCSEVLYDANVIIYYSSFISIPFRGITIELCMIETAKIHKLTKELVESGKKIITLKLVWEEIEKKGIARLIDDFCNNPQIKGKFNSKEIPDRVRLIFAAKMERKLKKIKMKEWFDITNYVPDQNCINTLKHFYLSLDGTPKMMEHFHKKGNYNPVPSYQDRALLCCSSEYNILLVSNDSDITDFMEELKKEGHCFEIFDLKKYKVQ